MSKLQNCWSSIADERGHNRGRAVFFVREEEKERERPACAQTSAGCYENSNEICVSYVGDHWLVPHTSLTHSLSRPSPLMLVYPSKRIEFKRDLVHFCGSSCHCETFVVLSCLYHRAHYSIQDSIESLTR